MAIAKGPIAITNRRGERGQPWHVPLERLKGLDIISFANTDATELLYKTLIQLEK